MTDHTDQFGWALTECLYAIPATHTPNTLLGHIPVITLLTRLANPNVTVDLGVARSSVFEAVSSAIRRFNLDTSCYGIFEGSDSDANSSIDAVLRSVSNNYPQSTVIVGDTGKSAALFDEGSIDILTISHLADRSTIEDVITEWLPKLSDSGIVLIATINHPSPHDPFRIFWQNVKNRYSSFDFSHQFGLGVLFVGQEQKPLVRELVENLNNNPYFSSLFSSMCEYNGVVMQERLTPQVAAQIQIPGRAGYIAERADLLFKHSRAWKLLAPMLRRISGFRRLEEATR
ncbi:hypothetical protein [Brucella pseudogrignonensis]|uniref:Class I SAM-dependent methyltransferase n=1 Tax=Brucella pseudogrignonensis TaxID=419475 RepID=A0ABU1M858_9HYPH|nr:hypothetical protein [Brucella pseudogrignonensis]MDR6432042.1 hypothetical protein [Brucella pseudogrignonensis]